jgi:integrase
MPFVCEPVRDGHRSDRQVVTVDDQISDEFRRTASTLLFIVTGLRIFELLGLRWVDFG